ncbi:MAG: sulfotransferase domain-containing protein [Cyclobacteriaceae bacterium]
MTSVHRPDVFVIGAMKAGTSTLFRNILVHPKIDRTRSKEVNFFLEDHTQQDLDRLYKMEFRHPDLLKCDVSPKYSQCHKYKGVAARIYKANPKAKIVYLIRDPIKRVESHLHHNLLRDRYSSIDLHEEINNKNDYIQCSKYHFQISEYLQFFPASQILVLMLEELALRPDVFCQRLGKFLGLTFPAYQPNEFNVSERRYQIKYYDWVHQYITWKPMIKFYHYFWLMMNVKPERPVLSEEMIERLKMVFREDVNRLADQFALDLNLWPNFARQP